MVIVCIYSVCSGWKSRACQVEHLHGNFQEEMKTPVNVQSIHELPKTGMPDFAIKTGSHGIFEIIKHRLNRFENLTSTIHSPHLNLTSFSMYRKANSICTTFNHIHKGA